MTDDDDTRHLDVAGYVLGGLSPDDQVAFEAHLATCEQCQGALAELDPLPVLLELARPAAAPTAAPASTQAGAVAQPAPAPPEESADGADAADAPRGRSRRRVLVGAALAATLVVGLALGAVATRPDQPTFSTPVALAAGTTTPTGDDGAAGTAAWRATSAGTEVRLDLTGLQAAGTYYECLWISDQGVQSAGTFRAAPDGSVQVDLVTAATRYPGWRLEIRAHPDGSDGDGTVVLGAPA